MGTALILCASAHAQDLDALLGEPLNASSESSTDSNPDAAPASLPASTNAPLDSVPVAPLTDAPEATSDAPPPPRSAALEEIIVTAERRVASLQDTPISIEAFSAEKIEQIGIQGVQDLGVSVPSMTIEPFPTHNATLRIFIRGVGINDAQLTQDPAVGVYVDGVYIARSVGLAMDIADLERIEVLRGPQGTLYGRNTTGGAVNLITRRPSVDGFAMTHKLTLGNRNYWLGRSSINVPVGDTLAFKLALLGSTRDGYVDNTGEGGNFGDRKETGLRFDARWLATERLTADYAYDRSRSEYYNYMFQAVLPPNSDKGDAELFKPYAQANTIYSHRRLDALASGAPMEASGTTIHGHALTLTLDLEPFELKYIGAFRELDDKQYADLAGGTGSPDYRLDSNAYDGPAATVANGGPTPLVIPTVTQQQWSHELQLSGHLFDEQLDYVMGAYLFSEHGREDRHRLNHQFSTAIEPAQIGALVAALPADLGNQLLTLAGPRLVNFVDLDWTIDNRASALFSQATWTPDALDQRLHLTVGYRHSEDERKAVKFRVSDTYVEGQVAGIGTAIPLSSAEKFDNVPARKRFSDDAFAYVLAYDLSDSVNIYGKSVEAYKSGGFNVRDPNIDANSQGNTYGFGFVDGFAPEHVQSYELGLKSEWLERRLRINADVFDSAYRDMQINFLIPGTISDTKTENAGRARMRGLELDTTWLATSALILSANYAYLDARVEEVRDADGNNVAELYPFTSAPRYSFVVAADWTMLERDWGALRAYATYNYIDEREGTVITEERRGLTSIPAYGLFNARLSATDLHAGNRGTLDIAVWGRNLADKVYPIAAIDNLPQADRAVIWGEPRSFGLDLIYRYR
ncbi:TonB-dependent receptor [Sinimarinibacterium sp. CAU 1509]|nr:TonB-dependent receptor [Sinimarinibacterium sp. CAU 1509]